MTEISQEEFLLLNMTEDKRFGQIATEYSISRKQLSDWWISGENLRSEISKSNQIFNNKKNKQEFSFFKNKRQFFEWYRANDRKCFYCGIEEYKLKILFGDSGVFKTKRLRGKSLELERKDAINNIYSDQNCVLACYLCNNHKSDYISGSDHVKYFSSEIRRYLEDKFSSLIKC